MKHQNADILIAIAEGKQIQRVFNTGDIIDNISNLVAFDILKDIEAGKHPNYYLRVKPDTVLIYGIAVPKAETTAIQCGTYYWVPNISGAKWALTNAYTQYKWQNDPTDLFCLEAGLVHLTPESAIKHSAALVALNKGLMKGD